MWDCESELRRLVRGIEPSSAQKSGASRSHNHLRNLLDTGEFGNRIVDSYLSGSYARDTAISPIDDVDIIVVVDPEGWPRRFLNSHPDPDSVLQSFARAIRYRYPHSRVHVQRRSVRLNLYHLDIDVVPAIALKGDRQLVEIPDADSEEWLTSAPRRHSEIATEINLTHGGRFKPLVKLLKYWNCRLPKTADLKSFAIETMAARVFCNVGLPTIQDGLRRFFDFMAGRADQAILYRWTDNYGIQLSWWAHEVPDLAGTGSNLVARVDSERRKKFLEHAIRARDALIQAERARTPESSVQRIGSALRMI
jgi:hypothetical protein